MPLSDTDDLETSIAERQMGITIPTETDFKKHLALLGRIRRRNEIIRIPADPSHEGKTRAEIYAEKLSAVTGMLSVRRVRRSH